MRVTEIAAAGGPEVLIVGSRPTPGAGAGEVLIAVAAAGVNRPDVMQRKGMYPPPAGASDIPGLEIAGTVVAIGEGVASLVVGDQVCALVTGGGYAEFCIAPEVQCLPVPRGLTMIEAASLPENYFTVWTNVFDRGRLARGESLLVQGGSSGIGVSAIQIAHALGSRVFATAGSPVKCAACERLGAERAINYPTEDFVEVTKSATGGRGVDVILDMIGGDDVPRESRDRPARRHGQASHHHRLHAQGAIVGVQGRYRALIARERLAASRERIREARRARDLSARARERSAPLDGVERTHRQDRAHSLEP